MPGKAQKNLSYRPSVNKFIEGIIEGLVVLGAHVNEKNKDNFTALEIALNKLSKRILNEKRQKDTEASTISQERAVRPSSTSSSNTYDELTKAIIYDNTQQVKFLIKQGLKVDKVIGGNHIYSKHTYLGLASSSFCNGNIKIIGALLKAGASVNIRDCDGRTPLIEASNIKVANKLMKAGARINVTDKKGNTPLHIALSTFNWDLAQELLKQKANVDTSNKKGNTVLHILAGSIINNIELMRKLTQSGANVNVKNLKGKMPLHKAAKKNNIEEVRELIKQGAHVCIVDNKGNTPLHSACKCIFGHSNEEAVIIELLKGQGIEMINTKNDMGMTPLMLILSNYASVETIKTLIVEGAEITSRARKKIQELNLLSKIKEAIIEEDLNSKTQNEVTKKEFNNVSTLQNLCCETIRKKLRPIPFSIVAKIPLSKILQERLNELLFDFNDKVSNLPLPELLKDNLCYSSPLIFNDSENNIMPSTRLTQLKLIQQTQEEQKNSTGKNRTCSIQ